MRTTKMHALDAGQKSAKMGNQFLLKSNSLQTTRMKSKAIKEINRNAFGTNER